MLVCLLIPKKVNKQSSEWLGQLHQCAVQCNHWKKDTLWFYDCSAEYKEVNIYTYTKYPYQGTKTQRSQVIRLMRKVGKSITCVTGFIFIFATILISQNHYSSKSFEYLLLVKTLLTARNQISHSCGNKATSESKQAYRSMNARTKFNNP